MRHLRFPAGCGRLTPLLPRHRRLAVLLLLPLTLSGCAGLGGSTPAPEDTPTPATEPASTVNTGGLIPAIVGLPPEVMREAAYEIGPEDVLRIEVFNLPELTTKVRVNEHGVLTMPLLGEVPANGLTAAQLAQRIETGLAKDYVQHPQVNVFIETHANLSITVSGAVAKPGVFPLIGKLTLLEAVAQAGGVSRLANIDEVVLFREQADDQVQAYIVDMAAIEKGELRDPVLAANDKIRVPESGAAVLLQTVTGTLRGFVSPL